MKTIIFALLLTLVGCGQPIEYTYHYNTPKEQIVQKCGFPWCDAFAEATWKWNPEDAIMKGHGEGYWSCDIWMQPREHYGSEACWNAMLEHERRHCSEDSFHPETPEGSMIVCN